MKRIIVTIVSIILMISTSSSAGSAYQLSGHLNKKENNYFYITEGDNKVTKLDIQKISKAMAKTLDHQIGQDVSLVVPSEAVDGRSVGDNFSPKTKK